MFTPKLDIFTERPPPKAQRSFQKRGVEILQKTEAVNDYKETMSSRHSRAATHVESQCKLKSDHTPAQRWKTGMKSQP